MELAYADFLPTPKNRQLKSAVDISLSSVILGLGIWERVSTRHWQSLEPNKNSLYFQRSNQRSKSSTGPDSTHLRHVDVYEPEKTPYFLQVLIFEP